MIAESRVVTLPKTRAVLSVNVHSGLVLAFYHRDVLCVAWRGGLVDLKGRSYIRKRHCIAFVELQHEDYGVEVVQFYTKSISAGCLAAVRTSIF